jgi:hypothetical protein
MDNIKEHRNPKQRQMEMVRICWNLFSSIKFHGIAPAVKSEVVEDMKIWNKTCYEEISCDQLVDFIAQVVEGVFGKSINSAPKSSPDITIPDQSEPENA